MVVSLPEVVKLSLPLAVPNCIECGSTEFVQTNDEYIAGGECGLVSEDMPIVLSVPFARRGGFLSSHTVLHRGFGTLTGSATEGGQSSSALQRGTRLAGPDYLATMQARGHAAIRQILGILGCGQTETMLAIASRLFWQFNSLMPRGSIARNVGNLATAAILSRVVKILKILKIPVNESGD